MAKKARKHGHAWRSDLTCSCGEVHPIVAALRLRIEDLERQQTFVPSATITLPIVNGDDLSSPNLCVSTNGIGHLDPDLQAIVEEKKASPQQRAKMARFAFSYRGWPNEEHPGTVRDFLVEHGVPIIEEVSRG